MSGMRKNLAPKNLKPLKEINRWLKQHKFDSLYNMSEAADLGSNAVLFGGCYHKLNVAGARF